MIDNPTKEVKVTCYLPISSFDKKELKRSTLWSRVCCWFGVHDYKVNGSERHCVRCGVEDRHVAFVSLAPHGWRPK